MRIWQTALAAVVGIAPLTAALAQPYPAQPAGISYDYYAQEPPAATRSPSDAAPIDEPMPASPSISAASGCDTGGACCAPSCGCNTCCEAAPLFTFGGWLNGGFTYNTWEPPSHYNGPLSFNDRDDEFQMNQSYLYVERQVDTSDRLLDFGGRADMLYGTDGRFTKAVGLELEQNGAPGLNAGQRFYHLAFPQFYGDVGIGRLTVRTGHWYTIMGYESVMAPANFFYSHAYTMQYGEPFTHTGMLLQFDQTENLTWYAGVHNGWDIFSVANTGPAFTNRGSFIGGMSWKLFDGILWGTSTQTIGNELNNVGFFGNRPSFYQQRDLTSNLLGVQVTERLGLLGQLDIGEQIGGSRAVEGQRAEWYGALLYLTYELTPQLKFGSRSEWFRDDDGARVAAVGNANPAQGPFVGNFYEFTMGFNWLPADWFILRPEMRWDWFGPSQTTGGASAFAFNDGTRNSRFTMGMDGIISW